MNKKVLFTASVKSHIAQFHIPYLDYFKQNSYEVHVAAKDNSVEMNIELEAVDRFYNIPFERSPASLNNIKAYRALKEILKDNEYAMIHCHTPMASVITRIASKNTPECKAKVIYTAHGFHFYKGAPLLNWLLYYPVEKWLSRYTDCLITINQEDYQRAVSHHFKAGGIHLVNGIGIDLTKFTSPSENEKQNLRKKYGYTQDAFILLYAAELTYRKHQDFLIRVTERLKHDIPNIKLLFAGIGPCEKQYKDLTEKLGLNNSIDFLGFRTDIHDLMKISDAAVSSSRQEGLPVSIMEAMATGLPAVVSDCRGNRDLVVNGENGYVIAMDNIESFTNRIIELHKVNSTRQLFGNKSMEVVKKYSLKKVVEQMGKIYRSYE